MSNDELNTSYDNLTAAYSNDLEKNDLRFFNLLAEKTSKYYDLTNLFKLSNNIECKKRDNFTIPEWLHDKFNETYTYEKLVHSLSTESEKLLYLNSEYVRMAGGNILNRITKDMTNFIQGKDNIKFTYYSTGKEILMVLMEALSIYNNLNINYGSCLMIEIWKSKLEKMSKSIYYVKFFLRHRNDTQVKESYTRELFISNCKNPCNYDNFIRLTQHLIIYSREHMVNKKILIYKKDLKYGPKHIKTLTCFLSIFIASIEFYFNIYTVVVFVENDFERVAITRSGMHTCHPDLNNNFDCNGKGHADYLIKVQKIKINYFGKYLKTRYIKMHKLISRKYKNSE
ncbi:hypothetical protein A3Q56_02831, partial [Intoshia linei]